MRCKWKLQVLFPRSFLYNLLTLAFPSPSNVQPCFMALLSHCWLSSELIHQEPNMLLSILWVLQEGDSGPINFSISSPWCCGLTRVGCLIYCSNLYAVMCKIYFYLLLVYLCSCCSYRLDFCPFLFSGSEPVEVLLIFQGSSVPFTLWKLSWFL